MRSASSTLITKESANKRNPIELYHFWMGDNHWYLTSGDTAIEFNYCVYVPAYLERSAVTFNANFDASTLTITIPGVNEPVLSFLNYAPSQIIWVAIYRLMRDQEPYEASTIFIGNISEATQKAAITKIQCVGFEYYLQSQIPRFTYQRTCNWTPFDSRCGLTPIEGITQLTTTVEVDASRTILGSLNLTAFADNFFTLGLCKYGNHYRMVAAHGGNMAILRYPMPDIKSGDTVIFTAGCNQTLDVCLSKFNNVANFGGWPYIPLDNPCLWI